MVNRNGTVIQWNSENLPVSISQDSGDASSFSYAPDQHRYYQAALIAGVSETTVYAGGYEAWTRAGVTTFRHHLTAYGREVAEVDLTNSGSSVVEKVSYVLTDHLGSVDDVQGSTSAAGGRKPGAAVITNASGTPVADMSFSAWGGRREPGTWEAPVSVAETQTDHNADRYGFTHQEMLDDVQGSTSVAGGRKPGATNVNLIHMNGRVYDPTLGRFLSVDPIFEFPTNTQSLNPYSYVLNNPLSMTDPTGYAPSCVTNKDGSTTCTGNVIVTGTHIAQQVSATVSAKGGPVSFSGPLAGPGGHSLMLGDTTMTATAGVNGSNGVQNSNQGPSTSLGLSTSSSQGNNTSPALSSTVTSSNSTTSGNNTSTVEGTATNEEQEAQLMQKTWKDLPGAIKFWEKENSAQDLAQYAKDKLIIMRGFVQGETAATCATGCEPGLVSPNDPHTILLYTGAALAAGYTQEGGNRGTMFIVAHEFEHTTLRNQEMFSEYERQHPNLDAYTLGQEERNPAIHDSLPWENDANEFGREILEAYNLTHPP